MEHANAGKVHLCTLPARASNYILINVGWVGGFPAHSLGDYLPSIVGARQSPWYLVCTCYGLPAYANWRACGDRRKYTRTPYVPYCTFYPCHISSLGIFWLAGVGINFDEVLCDMF